MKSTLATVTSGNADAAVVYVSDVVSAGSTVTGVPIPSSQNIIAVYPIAILKSSKNQAADQAFVKEISRERGAGAQECRVPAPDGDVVGPLSTAADSSCKSDLSQHKHRRVTTCRIWDSQ